MQYSYFPGCSLERNAEAYHKSIMAIAEPLDLDLVEVDDWNCCGATEYISLDMLAAYALIARNLAQAVRNPGYKDLVAPCSACFLNLSKCDKYMRSSPDLAAKVNEALAAGGLSYQAGSLRIRHFLDVVVNDVGYEAVKAHVTKPLQGLRVVPYYGCLIARPGLRTTTDDPEHPTALDDLLAALGADVVTDFPLKSYCCGGHMTQISEGTAFGMIRHLVKTAHDAQADLMVTLCPMCQLNLDAFQGSMNRYFKSNYYMPVLYFTQLMGLAFGLEAEALGIGAELVDARPALLKIGVEMSEAASAAAPKKPRKDDKALPMPRMPKQEARR